MKPTTGDEVRQEAPRALCLFLGMLLVYSATTNGNLDNLDAESRFSSAMSLVRHGDFDADMHFRRGRLRSLTALSDNGRRYPVYNFGQALVMTPFYLAGRGLAGVLRRGEAFGADLGCFLASVLMFPLVSAAICLVFYLIQKDVGVSEPAAAGSAALVGFGTLIWQYCKFPAEETQIGLLLLLGFRHGLLYARSGGRVRDAAIFGAALGGALLFRVTAAPAAGVIGLSIVLEAVRNGSPGTLSARGRSAVLLGSGAAGAASAAALLGFYNWWRFGGPLATGYTESGLLKAGYGGAFGSPLLSGLAGQLLSPGKSVFLYCPLILLSCMCIRRWRQRFGWGAAAVPGALGATVLFYSKYYAWHGDWAWGPRFLTSVLPLACIPLGTVLEQALAERGRRLKATAAVAVLSVAVQALSVSLGYGVEFKQRGAQKKNRYYWSLRDAPVLARAANVTMLVAGRRQHRGAALSLHVWPNYLLTELQGWLVPPAMAAWFASLVGGLALLACALGPRALWRAPPSAAASASDG